MATNRSLGVLTIDLLARTSGFTQEMDKASRKAKSSSDQIWASVEKVRLATVALGATAAVAAGAWVTSMAKAGEEIGRLSKLSNASAEEFQKMAYAAKTVGIEQDKLSDILKDVNDKVGDFLVTGGGPMLDFFEQIAPKIGVTADQFRGLSGPQALELYISSLEKAGVSQAEMTFFMEALANDATLLIPLMEDNASAMRALGDEAVRLGVVMGDDAVAASKALDLNLNRLQAMASGLSVTLANQMLPRINDFIEYAIEAATETDGLHTELTELVNDAAIPGWIDALGIGMARVADVAVALGKTIAAVHSSFKAVAADAKLASDRYGLGMDMTWATSQVFEDIEEDTENLSRSLDERNKVVQEANQKWIDLWEGDGNRFEQAWIRAGEKAKFDRDFVGPIPATTLPSITVPGAVDGGGSSAASTTRIDEGERYIESLKRQLESVAKLTELETLRQRMAEGAVTFSSQAAEDQAVAYAQTIDFIREQEEAFKAQEQAARTMAEATGTYWEEWLAAAEENLTSFDDLAKSVIENFSAQMGDAFESMVFDSENLGDALSGIAENMARSVINALGQMAAQWLAYQAVQLLVGRTTQASSASALTANAMATSLQAGLAAFASTAAIPIVGPALAPAAMGAALAITTPLATAVGLTALSGMAHDGIDSIPETGTWLLQKGERVTTADTSAKLDATLERLNGDMNRGRSDAPVINVFEDSNRAGEVDTRIEDERWVVDVVVANIRNDGQIARAQEMTYGLARVGR